jgi:hypothetical protein
MKPLDEIQREFFSALQLPLRGTSRKSTELAPCDEGHSAGFLATADRLMKATATLSSAERLELYHRQYWFRVLDSVAEEFPVLQKMAGDEKFWELMEAYLQSCPSGSYTLRHLGRSMASFVAGWDGLDETRRRWFSALAEIEYAAMEVYEAAEREALPPERIATEVLELQPHVRLMAFPVAADRCFEWEAFTPEEESPVRLEAVEFVLLERLKEGRSLEELFADPVEPEPTAEEVQQWFSEWQSRGWITARGSEVIELAPQGDDWSGVDKMGSQARAMED